MYAEWQELRDYCEETGRDFHPEWMAGRDAALIEERERFRSRPQFFQRSEALLYHLTSIELSGWLQPVWRFIREAMPPCHTLDLRPGIGSTGLHLASLGYDVDLNSVTGADAGTCEDYARWRWKRRGLPDPVDVGNTSVCYQLVTCVGALGFMSKKEQVAIIDQAAQLGNVVVIDAHGRLPASGLWYPPALDDLVGAIEDRYTLVRHVVYDEFHHVLMFASGSTGSADGGSFASSGQADEMTNESLDDSVIADSDLEEGDMGTMGEQTEAQDGVWTEPCVESESDENQEVGNG